MSESNSFSVEPNEPRENKRFTVQQTEKKRGRGDASRGVLQVLAVLALLGLAVFVNMWMAGSAERKPLKKAPEARLPFVELATAQPYTGMLRVQANGTVEPAAYVNISPQVSGRVQRVMVPIRPGATFQKGQTLFAIETTDYDMEVTRLQADLSAAQANVETEQAEADAARAEWEEFGSGEISDLAARKPQLRAAKAKIAQIKAAIERAKLNIKRTRYSLPFSGRVADGAVVAGQLLTANQPYGRVYDYKSLEVRVALPDDDLKKIGGSSVLGTPVEISSSHDGNAQRYEGIVSRLAAEVDRSTRMRTVFVRFDTDLSVDSLPPPGTFVDAQFVKPMQGDTVVLPASAMQDGNGKLWLVDEKGTLQAAESVQVVQFVGGEVVVRGVHTGQRVVNGSLPEATIGMRVRWNSQDSGEQEQTEEQTEADEAAAPGYEQEAGGEVGDAPATTGVVQ